MPTASERADEEVEAWTELAEHWAGHEVSERAVLVFFDPRQDLDGRAKRWGHDLAGPALSHIAIFAAGLASAESAAWQRGDRDVATRAFEERRHLVGDRIIHWAVPWLEANEASDDRDFLLDIGDEMRVAPRLAGHEGRRLEGEDSYGPLFLQVPLEEWLRSLLSGVVLMTEPDNPAEVYRAAAARWSVLAGEHPGSEELWHDLSERAKATAKRLSTV